MRRAVRGLKAGVRLSAQQLRPSNVRPAVCSRLPAAGLGAARQPQGSGCRPHLAPPSPQRERPAGRSPPGPPTAASAPHACKAALLEQRLGASQPCCRSVCWRRRQGAVAPAAADRQAAAGRLAPATARHHPAAQPQVLRHRAAHLWVRHRGGWARDLQKTAACRPSRRLLPAQTA